MRVSIPLIKAAIAAATLAAMVGCSMPNWHGLNSKKNNSAASLAANAPVAPSFNPASPSPPTVTLGAGSQPAATGTLPTYPGTNYPVTPYPAAAPSGVATSPSPYGAAPTSYAAAPTATPAAQTASPYTAYPQQPTASPYGTTAPPMGNYNAAVPNSTYR